MEKKMVSCDEKKNGNACEFSGEKIPEPPVISARDEEDAVDSFYENLDELNCSNGLSLLFNFRKTILDLHLLYKEVIKKGGFSQVTENGKWDEIASTVKLISFVSMSPSQLQKIYEILLLQYEQMYCQKMSHQEPNTLPNHQNTSSPLLTTSVQFGDPDQKQKCSHDTCQVTSVSKKIDHNSTIIKEKKLRKDLNVDAPTKPRSGYQIFLKVECNRLKKIHGESCSRQNLRNKVIEAWRRLPDDNKKPYIEASKKDKERYGRQMAAYEQQKKMQNTKNQSSFGKFAPSVLNFSKCLETDQDDYRVSLETHSGNFPVMLLPDEYMVESAMEEMKNGQSVDPIFGMDWDGSSLDMTS